MQSKASRALPRLLLQSILAALAGALHVLCFAPFGWWPLQILLLLLLFAAVLRAPSTRHAACLGWAFGFGWYVVGVSWLFISLHRYGGMQAWLAMLAVALLALLLGAFTAFAMGTADWLRRRSTMNNVSMALLLLPAAWALGDWLRGWVFTGFPWIVTGYAQVDSPLAGFAPLLGVYGIGWIVALIAGSLLLLKRCRLLIALPILLLLGAQALREVSWTSNAGAPITVRLLQGNVAQDLKFDAAHLYSTLAYYDATLRREAADLIVTPETAIPMLSTYLPSDYLPRLAEFSRQSGSTLVLGIPLSDGPAQYANSVLALRPNGQFYRYDKHHLVPFGEFIPWGFRWFVDLLQIPLGDFTRGALQQPALVVKDQRIQPNICYEDLFGEQIAATVRGEASRSPTILLNLSNIAWFGDSIALPQHLQISRMRALETGRPMLRATNTGTTAVIGAHGEVIAQLPPFTRGVLNATVQGTQGLTPYSRFGNGLLIPLLLLLCLWPLMGTSLRLFFLRRNPPHKS